MGKKLLPIRKVELYDENPQPHWYVMMVQYQEKFSKTLMDKVANMGLEDMILETFIPTRVYEEVVPTADGKKTKKVKRKEPIWPTNYILIRMLMTSETWSICRNTNFAMGWLNADGRPKVIAESEVVSLKELCGVMNNIKVTATANFNGKVGDHIRVVNHMFVNKEGDISAIDGSTITVMLENGFKVQLEPYQVEVITNKGGDTQRSEASS